MVAAKKTKKAQESINSRLALVMKSGAWVARRGAVGRRQAEG